MELWWLITFLAILFPIINGQGAHRRFEYKYSFKGPYLAQKDNQVPFWTYSGNAIASEESVRITPSLRSQKGQIWTKNPTSFEWWEVEFVFRVTGRGRIGADGLAFWFTAAPGNEGPVFGSSDKWSGLGVFFDSFDNDNKRNNPYIMAMVNDGTLIYDHEHDGVSQQLGGCLRDFRNKPFPVRAKIEYYKNILTVRLQQVEYDFTDLIEDLEKRAEEDEEQLTSTSAPLHYWENSEQNITRGNDEVFSEGNYIASQMGTDTDEQLSPVNDEVTGSETDGQSAGWGSWFNVPETTTVLPEVKTENLDRQRKVKKKSKKMKKKMKKKKIKRMKMLMIHNGMTNNEKDYEICMRSENVRLPSNGYFGVTAATGGLADDHDVLKFLTSSLRSPEEMASLIVNKEEEEKFRQEFKEYQEKTKKAREEYVAQNPDAARQTQEEEFETGEQRELRQIFQGQSQIHEIIRGLHAKMDEIIGRQERTLGLVGSMQTGVAGQVATPQQGVPPPTADGIQRHEINSLISNQRDIVNTALAIKNLVSEMHSVSNQLLGIAQKPQGSAQPVGYDLHVTLNEMKESINVVKRDVGSTSQRLGAQQIPSCPQVSCVSTAVFLIFMVIQIVILIGYILYRDNKEAQAKKFY
ncbi:lectin, mannose binding protein ergic53 isoform X2 [Oratosquilla oratoria]|uniref:lectin, mannose binding protein ergic53 isoform X2 n=1 Tax=Oratosquilla oratoria TaxID=337810 RepID=UPI003F767E92